MTNLIDKLEIYDPMDSRFDVDGDDQAMKTDELKDRIRKMPGLKGSLLSTPLPNKTAISLYTMINKEFKQCQQLCLSYIEKAKVQGNSFKDNILHEAVIQKYAENL